jgi:hypothetical protein
MNEELNDNAIRVEKDPYSSYLQEIRNDPNAVKTTISPDLSTRQSIKYGSNVGSFGLDDFNKYDPTYMSYQDPTGAEYNQEELRAENQGVIDAGWKMVISRTASVPLKALSTLGYIYGAGKTLATGNAEDIWNNELIDLMDKSDKYLSENLKVYADADYNKGNILDQLSSAKFYENLLDGVAYSASSMLYGGGVGMIGKAFGATGIGAKALQVLGAAIPQTISEAGQEAKDFYKSAKNSAGLSDDGTWDLSKDNYYTRQYKSDKLKLDEQYKNTLDKLTKQSQGIEGEGLSVDNKKAIQELNDWYNRKLNELSAKTTQELNKNIGKNVYEVYGQNIAALSVSNLIESSLFFGNPLKVKSNTIKELGSKLESDIAKEELLKTASWLNKTKHSIPTGVISEGLYEENIQDAIQNIETKKASNKINDNLITTIGKELNYAVTNWSDIDKQRSVLIGSLVGIGGAGIGAKSEAKEERQDIETTKKIYDNLLKVREGNAFSFIGNVNDLYEYETSTDADGKVTKSLKLDDEGKPVIKMKDRDNGIFNLEFSTLKNKQGVSDGIMSTIVGNVNTIDYIMSDNIANTLFAELTNPLSKSKDDAVNKAITQLSKNIESIEDPELQKYYKDNIDRVKDYARSYEKALQTSSFTEDMLLYNLRKQAGLTSKTEDDKALYNDELIKAYYKLDIQRQSLEHIKNNTNDVQEKEDIQKLIDDKKDALAQLEDVKGRNKVMNEYKAADEALYNNFKEHYFDLEQYYNEDEKNKLSLLEEERTKLEDKDLTKHQLLDLQYKNLRNDVFNRLYKEESTKQTAIEYLAKNSKLDEEILFNNMNNYFKMVNSPLKNKLQPQIDEANKYFYKVGKDYVLYNNIKSSYNNGTKLSNILDMYNDKTLITNTDVNNIEQGFDSLRKEIDGQKLIISDLIEKYRNNNEMFEFNEDTLSDDLDNASSSDFFSNPEGTDIQSTKVELSKLKELEDEYSISEKKRVKLLDGTTSVKYKQEEEYNKYKLPENRYKAFQYDRAMINYNNVNMSLKEWGNSNTGKLSNPDALSVDEDDLQNLVNQLQKLRQDKVLYEYRIDNDLKDNELFKDNDYIPTLENQISKLTEIIKELSKHLDNKIAQQKASLERHITNQVNGLIELSNKGIIPTELKDSFNDIVSETNTVVRQGLLYKFLDELKQYNLTDKVNELLKSKVKSQVEGKDYIHNDPEIGYLLSPNRGLFFVNTILSTPSINAKYNPSGMQPLIPGVSKHVFFPNKGINNPFLKYAQTGNINELLSTIREYVNGGWNKYQIELEGLGFTENSFNANKNRLLKYVETQSEVHELFWINELLHSDFTYKQYIENKAKLSIDKFPTIEQELALEQLSIKLSKPTKTVSLLKANAGTGKTTIVAKQTLLLNNIDGQSDKVLALCKNKEQLDNLQSEANIKNGMLVSDFSKLSEEEKNKYSHIIIDEIGQFSDYDLDDLSLIKNSHLILIGDSTQIGETNINKTLEEPTHTLREATEIQPLNTTMRTAINYISDFASMYQMNDKQVDSGVAKSSTGNDITSSTTGIQVTNNIMNIIDTYNKRKDLMSCAIVVGTEKERQAYLQQLRLPDESKQVVFLPQELVGKTVQAIFIDVQPIEGKTVIYNQLTKKVDYSPYNEIMYTMLTRPTTYALVKLGNGFSNIEERTDINGIKESVNKLEKFNKFLQQNETRYKDSLTTIGSTLGTVIQVTKSGEVITDNSLADTKGSVKLLSVVDSRIRINPDGTFEDLNSLTNRIKKEERKKEFIGKESNDPLVENVDHVEANVVTFEGEEFPLVSENNKVWYVNLNNTSNDFTGNHTFIVAEGNDKTTGQTENTLRVIGIIPNPVEEDILTDKGYNKVKWNKKLNEITFDDNILTNSNINTLSKDIIKTGNIQYANSLSYSYSSEPNQSNDLVNTIIKLIDQYTVGTGMNVVSFRVVIPTKASSEGFKENQYGIPQVEFITDKKAKLSFPLDPRRMTTEDFNNTGKYYQTGLGTSILNNLEQLLSDKGYNQLEFKLGNPVFDSLLSSFKDEFEPIGQIKKGDVLPVQYPSGKESTDFDYERFNVKLDGLLAKYSNITPTDISDDNKKDLYNLFRNAAIEFIPLVATATIKDSHAESVDDFINIVVADLRSNGQIDVSRDFVSEDLGFSKDKGTLNKVKQWNKVQFIEGSTPNQRVNKILADPNVGTIKSDKSLDQIQVEYRDDLTSDEYTTISLAEAIDKVIKYGAGLKRKNDREGTDSRATKSGTLEQQLYKHIRNYPAKVGEFVNGLRTKNDEDLLKYLQDKLDNKFLSNSDIFRLGVLRTIRENIYTSPMYKHEGTGISYRLDNGIVKVDMGNGEETLLKTELDLNSGDMANQLSSIAVTNAVMFNEDGSKTNLRTVQEKGKNKFISFKSILSSNTSYSNYENFIRDIIYENKIPVQNPVTGQLLSEDISIAELKRILGSFNTGTYRGQVVEKKSQQDIAKWLEDQVSNYTNNKGDIMKLIYKKKEELVQEPVTTDLLNKIINNKKLRLPISKDRVDTVFKEPIKLKKNSITGTYNIAEDNSTVKQQLSTIENNLVTHVKRIDQAKIQVRINDNISNVQKEPKKSEEQGVPLEGEQDVPTSSDITDISNTDDSFNIGMFDMSEFDINKGTYITVNEATKLVKQLIPDVKEEELQILTQMMLNDVRGANVYGTLKQGIMYSLQVEGEEGKGTFKEIIRHEAFHKIHTQYMTVKEQEQLAKAFEKEHGYLPYSFNELTEVLANDFMNWNKDHNSIKENWLKRFFNWLSKLFKFTYKNMSSLDTIYRDIEQGKYSHRIIENANVKNSYDLITIQEILGDRDAKGDIVNDGVDNFNKLKQEIFRQAKKLKEQGYTITETYTKDGVQHSRKVIVPVVENNLGNVLHRLFKEGAKQYKLLADKQEDPVKRADFLEKDKLYNMLVKEYEVRNLLGIKEKMTGFDYMMKQIFPVIKQELKTEVKEFTENIETNNDEDSDVQVDDIENVYEDYESTREGLKDEITNPKFTNVENVTALVKHLFSFVPKVKKTSEGQWEEIPNGFVNRKFVFKQMLEVLPHLDTTNIVNMQNQLSDRLSLSAKDNNDVVAIKRFMDKLFNDVQKINPITKHGWYDTNTFVYTTDGTTIDLRNDLSVLRSKDNVKIIELKKNQNIDDLHKEIRVELLKKNINVDYTELFNEFKLKQSLQSLLEITSAIGSYNNLSSSIIEMLYQGGTTTYNNKMQNASGVQRTLVDDIRLNLIERIKDQTDVDNLIKVINNSTNTNFVGNFFKFVGMEHLITNDNGKIMIIDSRVQADIQSKFRDLLVNNTSNDSLKNYGKKVEETDEDGNVSEYTVDMYDVLYKDNDVINAFFALLKPINSRVKDEYSSIVNSKNERVFPSTPSTWAREVLYKVVSLSEVNEDSSYIQKNIPKYWNTHTYSKNPLLKSVIDGTQHVYQAVDHDGNRTKTKNSTYGYDYTQESPSNYLETVFSASFLHHSRLKHRQEVPTYIQYFYTQAHRVNRMGAEMDILDRDKINKYLDGIIDMFIQRHNDNLQDIRNFKNYNKNNDTNFRVFNEAFSKIFEISKQDILNNTESTQKAYKELASNDKIRKQFIDNILNQFANRTERLVNVMIQKEMPIPKDLVSRINPKKLEGLFKIDTIDGKDKFRYLDGSRFKFTREDIQKLNNKKDGKGTTYTKYNNDTKKYEYDPTVLNLPIFKALVNSFYINNYINSYLIENLTAGDANFFNTGENMLKRLQLESSSGRQPLINDEYGMKEYMKVMVGSDIKWKKDDIKKQVEEQLRKNNTNEKLIQEVLNNINDDVTVTDGQTYGLPEYKEELNKGMGLSYGVGNINKTVYSFIGEDGVPLDIKSSIVILTDELCKSNPQLNNLRQSMRNHGALLYTMQSTVKIATPVRKSLYDTQSIMDGDMTVNTDNLIIYDNKGLRVPFNPVHEIDSTTAQPNQILSFLNVLGTNDASADIIYGAVADLMKLGLEKVQKQILDKNGKLDNKKFKQAILSRLEKDDINMSFALLTKDLDMDNVHNFPTLSNKFISSFSSMLEKNVIQQRLKGSKLILQSGAGISRYSMDENKRNLADGLQFSIRKDEITGKTVMNLECLFPKGLLPEVLEDSISKALESGKDIDVLPYADAFGFRIPSSELHSAVALKIKGFYQSVDTNVVVVSPFIVFQHGCDYDVDSLFIITREGIWNYDEDVQKDILNKEEELTKVYEKYKDIEIILKDTDERKDEIKALKGQLKYASSENKLVLQERINELYDEIYSNQQERKGILEDVIDQKQIIMKDISNIKKDAIANNKAKYELLGYKDGKFDNEFNTTGLSSKDKEIYLKNKITENLLDVVTDEKNWVRMTKPISTDPMTDEQIRLWKDNHPEQYKELQKTTLLEMSKEKESKWIKDNMLSKPLNLSDVLDNLDGHQSVFSGKAGVGIVVAYGIKALAHMVRASKDKGLPTITDNKYNIQFNDVIYDKLSQYEYGGKEDVWTIIDALANAALDNVKLQILPNFYLTNSTLLSYIAMLGLGVESQVRNTFITQPAIELYTGVNAKWKNEKMKLSKNIINKRIAELSKGEKVNEIETLTTDMLLKSVNQEVYSFKNGNPIYTSTDIEFLKIQLAVLKQLDKLDNIGTEISKVARLLGVLRDLKTTSADLDKMIDLLNEVFELNDKNELQSKDSFMFDISNILNTLPHFKQALETMMFQDKLIRDNFVINSEVIRKFQNDIFGDGTVAANIEAREESVLPAFEGSKYQKRFRQREEVMRYLYTSLFNYSQEHDYITNDGIILTGEQAFIQHFLDKIRQVKSYYSSNKDKLEMLGYIPTFMNKVSVRPNTYTKEHEVRFNEPTEKTVDITANLHTAFNSLNMFNFNYNQSTGRYELDTSVLNSDSIKTLPKYSEFQTEFIAYMNLKNGNRLGSGGYSLGIPSALYNYNNRDNKWLNDGKKGVSYSKRIEKLSNDILRENIRLDLTVNDFVKQTALINYRNINELIKGKYNIIPNTGNYESPTYGNFDLRISIKGLDKEGKPIDTINKYIKISERDVNGKMVSSIYERLNPSNQIDNYFRKIGKGSTYNTYSLNIGNLIMKSEQQVEQSVPSLDNMNETLVKYNGLEQTVEDVQNTQKLQEEGRIKKPKCD